MASQVSGRSILLRISTPHDAKLGGGILSEGRADLRTDSPLEADAVSVQGLIIDLTSEYEDDAEPEQRDEVPAPASPHSIDSLPLATSEEYHLKGRAAPGSALAAPLDPPEGAGLTESVPSDCPPPKRGDSGGRHGQDAKIPASVAGDSAIQGSVDSVNTEPPVAVIEVTSPHTTPRAAPSSLEVVRPPVTPVCHDDGAPLSSNPRLEKPTLVTDPPRAIPAPFGKELLTQGVESVPGPSTGEISTSSCSSSLVRLPQGKSSALGLQWRESLTACIRICSNNSFDLQGFYDSQRERHRRLILTLQLPSTASQGEQSSLDSSSGDSGESGRASCLSCVFPAASVQSLRPNAGSNRAAGEAAAAANTVLESLMGRRKSRLRKMRAGPAKVRTESQKPLKKQVRQKAERRLPDERLARDLSLYGRSLDTCDYVPYYRDSVVKKYSLEWESPKIDRPSAVA